MTTAAERDELLNRRNALSTLLVGGTASLTGCLARPSPADEDATMAANSTLVLGDDAVIYADPPSTVATEAACAAANTLMLQQFLSDVGSTGRTGTIPPGDYPIQDTLTLPLKGRILGCGEDNTIIRPATATSIGAGGPFQGALLSISPNSGFLELAHFTSDTGPARARGDVNR